MHLLGVIIARGSGAPFNKHIGVTKIEAVGPVVLTKSASHIISTETASGARWAHKLDEVPLAPSASRIVCHYADFPRSAVPIRIREPAVSSLLIHEADDSIRARLPHAPLNRDEAWSLEAALTLAPGSGESVLKASRRIEGICRWAYIQMGRRRTPGALQARRMEVRELDARFWGHRGRVACP